MFGLRWKLIAAKWRRALVYYIDDIERIEDAFLEELLPYVSLQRRAGANKYRFRSDRVQSVLAFVLLRIALDTEYGWRMMPRLTTMKTGKPYLANLPGVHFNLSHCKKGVACGISDSVLGVDIQDYVCFKESLATRFMSENELHAAKAGDADTAFTRLWSMKESYGKYTGRGICYDMPGFTAVEGVTPDGCICQSHILENFVISVTSAEPLPLVCIHAAELPERCRMLEKESGAHAEAEKHPNLFRRRGER